MDLLQAPKMRAPSRLVRASIAAPCLALAVASAASCASSKGKKKESSKAPLGPVVRSVEVEGNEYFDDEELVEYLNLRPTPAISFGAKSYYLPGLEEADRRRIVEVYAAHGHYDANVETLEVEVEDKGSAKRLERRNRRRARKGKPPKARRQVAHVFIRVDEGLPARIESVRHVWSADFQDGAHVEKAEVEAKNQAEKGEVFSVPSLGESARAMRDALRSAGYAHAKVEEHATVDRRARIADVEFTIEPGEYVEVGEIRVGGLEFVPLDLVLREVDYAPGTPYSPALVQRIQASIYGMEVFSGVTVATGPPRGDGHVDLEVQVQEQKLQKVQAGVGLGIDPRRWEQRVSFRYRHDSIFGRLTRMDVIARAGYAEIPPLSKLQHGPIASLDLIFRKKGLLEKRLVWTEHPSVELGIQPGYQFISPRNRLSVTRFITRFVELGLSYNNRFVRFFNADALESGDASSFLGRDYRNPYILSFLSLEATLHLTDALIDPKNGAQLAVTYDFANRYLGSQFAYHKVAPELRLYYTALNRIQLAGRVGTGMYFPYGRDAGVPIDLKLYLGGAGDVRGWPVRHLSPRLEDCETDAAGVETCDSVPIGGYTSFLSNLEFRVRLVGDLWAAVFGDVGDVRAGVTEFNPAGWQVSTGGGIRYDSPIGILRADFGYRVIDDPIRFPERRPWAFHLSLGEAF